jgi:stage 0 sporulation protein B (sporulation initiation phosphotransferase)
MKKEWDALEVLKHSRHDWLNQLQLIKGNIALDRKDRVDQIIDEITVNARNESNLTNLNSPELALLLITFNWNSHYHFTVEYEVLGKVRDLSHYDQDVTAWCADFFAVLNRAVHTSADNHLSLSVDLTKEHPRFFLDFSGSIQDENTMETWITVHGTNFPIRMDEIAIHKEELSLELTLL